MNNIAIQTEKQTASLQLKLTDRSTQILKMQQVNKPAAETETRNYPMYKLDI